MLCLESALQKTCNGPQAQIMACKIAEAVNVVQVTFSPDVACEELSQAPAPLQPEPASLQPCHVEEETRKVLARPILHDTGSALAAGGCTI